ncbi:MAG: tRNA-specific 2-thiouridylase MnmA [Candidatus Yanofskybacteria bacterium GW2011_GWA1_41_6]|uniref:tRNA-specific 2-thiouridylase MnmA n=1 Tax=Candidatus Yanofskybacteria bacterium GW2011_GWA1_41_6 TaxID=1619020 RepID=A0A0G0YW86_9BACT|nr:MAG: tRNA-specific 2-thiouridylase MnmA [Candidatus Yanofskybacteria bacterium GW2011_GWA1_41_6]
MISNNKKARPELGRKVFVALSGGVDSSVAAALLKQSGYQVTGVFFKPWQPERGAFCNWKEERQAALAAATALGIPFKTWDFSKEYKTWVADYMINAYQHGLTPNPDVMCNKEIKFGLFLKRALKEGADLIATGHYVRRSPEFPIFNFQFPIKLLKGVDKNKDQSYFLWTLIQKQLKHSLFPVGGLTKPEVRKLAKKFKLPNYAKKDSQGICFIGPVVLREFLKHYLKAKTGKIVDDQSFVVGQHDGAQLYTIGQRHGLNIGNGQGPYFVTHKDLKKNIIHVTTDSKKLDQLRKKVLVKTVSWVGEAPKFPAKVSAMIRYRGGLIPVSVNKTTNGLAVDFLKPARALASGQSIVFYKGEALLGGGVIA